MLFRISTHPLLPLVTRWFTRCKFHQLYDSRQQGAVLFVLSRFSSNMNAKKVICLFDMDETLTKPRKKITKDMEDVLDQVKEKVPLAIVSGSDLPKLLEQFGDMNALKRFHYVFPENGLVAYKNGEMISKESILKHMGEEKIQRLINFCLRYLSELTLPAKRGNFIEFRDGVVNVCPVGRSCTQAEREEFSKYDQVHKVREKFVAALEKELGSLDLRFSIGGQISFDVFPAGWDKSFCLKHVVKDGFEEIHFFGDKTYPGGNDYEIFQDPRTIGHTVTSPDDTKAQLTKMFLS